MATIANAKGPRASGTIEVRLLRADGERPLYPEIQRLVVDAYPVMGVTTREALESYAARFEETAHEDGKAWAIAVRDGVLVGAMRLYDYVMNLRGRDAFAGGVGSVAVSLAHKRQGVARAMIAWYVEQYRARGAAFAVLHPFRPDFYRKLGFGYGTPVQRFRFAPASLRTSGAHGTVRLLSADDEAAIFACSERVRARTNGLMQKHRDVTRRALDDLAQRWAGVVDDGGTLRGFMQTFVTVSDEVNENELVVRDLHAEDDGYRAALLGYLRAQQDQFARIVIETQDPAFYLAADDPRDGSNAVVSPPATHRVAETGLGIMYRILDVERAFAHLSPSGARFVLRVEAEDVLVPEIGGAYTFAFGPDGPPAGGAHAMPQATLRAGITELSSLVAGSLRLRDVVRHGLASVEPAAAVDTVASLLDAPQPPFCTTRF